MSLDLHKRAGRERFEELIRWLLFTSAGVSVLTTVGIVIVLAVEAAEFFEHVTFAEFLFGARWTPLLEPRSFGVLPLVAGTVLIVAGSSVIALPIGLACGIYLTEYASPRVRGLVKPVLEVLAGVPTVVYGYFALLFVTPLLQGWLRPFGIELPSFNLLSAGIVMGLMIIPYIASLSEDAMRAVPRSMREGSYAMGATRLETAFRVVVPAAVSGVVGAVILGMSRAIGETMIVVVAGGQLPQMVTNPAQQGATVTAFIAQVALGDLPFGTLEYNSIFAAGLALLVLTLMFNLVAFWLQRRYREAY